MPCVDGVISALSLVPEITQMGYELAEALEAYLRYANTRQVPIYVTENGVSTDDDERRIEYIRRALDGGLLADGIDVGAISTGH